MNELHAYLIKINLEFQVHPVSFNFPMTKERKTVFNKRKQYQRSDHFVSDFSFYSYINLQFVAHPCFYQYEVVPDNFNFFFKVDQSAIAFVQHIAKNIG